MLKFELVYKALLRSKSFSIIFIVNFMLAIFSITFLQFFKSSVETSLESKARTLLGADLVINSRFPISEGQEKKILKFLPELKSYVRSVSTVSMVSTNERSRLMEVIELQKNLPFYGGLTFEDNSKFPIETELLKENEIWLHQDASKLLAINIGDSIKLSNQNFIVKKIVVTDSQKSTNFSGFMPRVYISPSGMARSKLIQFGSTARYKMNILLNSQLSNDALEKLENNLEDKIDRSLRVLSPNDGRDRLIRVLGFMTNFLSLVSLVSFFLGLVGLIYLYTGFLKKHKTDMRVLNDVGLKKKDLCITYLLHLMGLITAASVLVFGMVTVLGPSLEPIVRKYIDLSFEFNLDYSFFLKSFGTLILLSISIGIPLILPSIDFSNQNKRYFHYFIPFILFLLFISHIVTPMKYVGVLFAITIFILIGILFTIGSQVLKRIDFSGHFQDLSKSLAFKNIVREKKTSLTLFSAILLCVSLFSLIPQVGSSLNKALKLSAVDKPRFFVIDAQKEQIPKLRKQVELAGAELKNVSPMVRGRIIKVNDIDFREHSNKKKAEESDEAEETDRDELKNRAVNLSYRSKLKVSEKIIEGVDFSGKYNSEDFSVPVEVSVEKRYSKRRGIELGDLLTFDILGLNIPAKVVNIRTVKWTDFVPNFFLILQDGAINDAPNTILATISYGDYDAEKFLLELSNSFPSLTIVDVKNLFDEFSKMVTIITSITDRMSLFSISIGLIMCFIIIQYQMNLQKNNILRLKMIGIDNSTIKKSLIVEYGSIVTLASFCGILLGSIGSYFVSYFLFESYWEFRIDLLLLYFSIIPIMTVIIVSIFANRIISQKENQLFSE